MRTCSFRLQIASAAAMAVAPTVCSVARAEFRAEADRLALEIDLVTGETLQAMVERMFGSLREVVEAARRAIGQG
jgi:hypothetical protein